MAAGLGARKLKASAVGLGERRPEAPAGGRGRGGLSTSVVGLSARRH